MNDFITLNTYPMQGVDSELIALAIDKITSIEPNENDDGSIIQTINQFQSTYFVLETPTMILNMIEANNIIMQKLIFGTFNKEK